MIKWIKTQLNYRAKYLAAMEANKEASKNALLVLGKYEALTASLPLEHELSTQTYWKNYADRRLMRENAVLRKDLNHLRDVHSDMCNIWSEGISRYGVQMYGKWQPIDLAPDDTDILITDGSKIGIASKRDNSWFSTGFSFSDPVTGWLPLPEVPK